MNKLAFTLKLIFFTFTFFFQSVNSQTKTESALSDSIGLALTEIVNEGKAPGIIAAIISKEGIVAINSAGVRKAGSNVKFGIKDQVHLGSCGKAMTSAMIATLVADGKLIWETKLLDVLPELKDIIHPDYHNTTLWQLLTHRAGFPDLWTHNSLLTKEKRLKVIKEKLKSPCLQSIGEFNYSNLGYISAACMAEKITGLKWETLMSKRLFAPLGMSSAGFGAPGLPNQTDQPWGHHKYGNRWDPDQSDCAEVLSPAGRIHCNIEDWGKFLSLQLGIKNSILDSTYLKKLTEPVGFYAGGWGVAEHPWAKGKVLLHSGSNGIWYSTVAVAPKINRAYVVVTNSRDFSTTEDICTEILRELIRLDI